MSSIHICKDTDWWGRGYAITFITFQNLGVCFGGARNSVSVRLWREPRRPAPAPVIDERAPGRLLKKKTTTKKTKKKKNRQCIPQTMAINIFRVLNSE